MSPVVHFEMGYNDKDRMVKFYESVFGWKTKAMGAEMSNYVVAETTKTDAKTQRPTEPGNINGGFYAKTDNPASHAPSVVIAVSDIRAAMKEVEKAGGKIAGAMNEKGEKTMEPMMIPGVGLWISIIDTEGNRVSMLQPSQM
jgi:predicted enzyme related to lactoylglutathione lyase